MNNLIKYLNQWANRLVISILTITGTPKEQIDRVLNAMESRNAIIDAGDKRLRVKIRWVKYLIITVLLVAIIYIYFKIKRLRK